MRLRLVIVMLAIVAVAPFVRWYYADAQSCTTTLNPGANLASAVSSAANGSTICLNSGSYSGSGVQILNVTKSGAGVTVRSTTGVGATISGLIVRNSHFITFDSLTLNNVRIEADTGGQANTCSTNITVRNSAFSPNQSQLAITTWGASCGSGSKNIIIEDSTFVNGQQTNSEGRLGIRSYHGTIVRRNVFSGQPASNPSDGVQMLGSPQNVLIEGNTFHTILVSQCGATRCDPIQDVGGSTGIIRDNLLYNNDTYIMMPDGSNGWTIEGNILYSTSGNEFGIQLGSAVNPIFRHNTLYGTSAAFDGKADTPLPPPTSNLLAENNIFAGGAHIKTSGGAGCSNCTFRFNLFNSSGNAVGTNNIIGTPIFVGPGNPPGSNWAGWKLAVGSPGRAAGNDGLDMGTLFYGVTSPMPPSAPTGFRIGF